MSFKKPFTFSFSLLLLLTFYLNSNAFGRVIVVAPTENKKLSESQKEYIDSTIKKYNGLSAGVYVDRPLVTLNDELHSNQVMENLKVDIKEVPSLIWDLWVIKNVLSDFNHLRDLKSNENIYFHLASELMPLISKNSNDEVLSLILKQISDLDNNSIPRLPAQGGHVPEHGQHLHTAIASERDSSFFQKVLNLEKEAIENDHVLLWRGTNGHQIETKNGTVEVIDSILPTKFFSDDFVCTNINLKTLSYGESLLGGAIFDGFSRPCNSASSYVYYKNGFKYLYALSIPRKDFFKYRKARKGIFQVSSDTGAAYPVLSGGDHFHPWTRAENGVQSISKGQLFHELIENNIHILSINDQKNSTTVSINKDSILSNHKLISELVKNKKSTILEDVKTNNEYVFQAIRDEDLRELKRLIALEANESPLEGKTPLEYAQELKATKVETSPSSSLYFSSDSDSEDDPIGEIIEYLSGR